MKIKIVELILATLGLCWGLTGCADLTDSINTSLAPQGMLVGGGTVTAVNAADRTIELKTDQGQTIVLSVTDTTRLQKPTYNLVLFGSDYKPMSFAEVEVGKYLAFTCSKEPVDGKQTATEVQMYASKSAADNY